MTFLLSFESYDAIKDLPLVIGSIIQGPTALIFIFNLESFRINFINAKFLTQILVWDPTFQGIHYQFRFMLIFSKVLKILSRLKLTRKHCEMWQICSNWFKSYRNHLIQRMTHIVRHNREIFSLWKTPYVSGLMFVCLE